MVILIFSFQLFFFFLFCSCWSSFPDKDESKQHLTKPGIPHQLPVCKSIFPGSPLLNLYLNSVLIPLNGTSLWKALVEYPINKLPNARYTSCIFKTNFLQEESIWKCYVFKEFMRIHSASSSPATQLFYVLDFLNPFSAWHHADHAGQPHGPRHTRAVHPSRHLSGHAYQGGFQGFGAGLNPTLSLLE